MNLSPPWTESLQVQKLTPVCVHRAWERAGSQQMSVEWVNKVDIKGEREYFHSMSCPQGTFLETFFE